MKLTVIVIAKNEARVLSRCLSSVRFADEIIVLDSGSTDDTVAIAKQFTPFVFETDWQGFGIQKQRALSHATGDFVLNLDADEWVTPALQAQIQAILKHPTADAYRIPIRMCFYDSVLKFSASPSRHARLFKREGAYFSSDPIHEKIVLPCTARIQQLRAPIVHHSFHDLHHAIAKMNRYSSASAKEYLAAQRKASLWRAIGSASWLFFRCYILQAGCLDGRLGFIFAMLQAQGSFYRKVKQIYPDKALIAMNTDET